MERRPTPIFLDCDTGIDDAVALAYLLAVSSVDLVGVGTVSGNTSADQAAINTLDLLAVAKRSDIPVAIGQHDWRAWAFNGGSPHVHGNNGVGDVPIPRTGCTPVPESAAELLIRLSHANVGLQILAIGPLTNLARALDIDPSLPSRISKVTIMGGAALVPGNVTPVAEANIWHDPEAASMVVSADWDIDIVPLDLTMEHVFDEQHQRQLLRSKSELSRLMGEMLDFYFDFYVRIYGRRCCALHDPLAAAIASGQVVPTYAPTVPVEVDTTNGPGRGQTIVDMREQRVRPTDHDGVRTRVIFKVEGDFAQHLLDTIGTRDHLIAPHTNN